jgi:hypothetical protein
MYKKIVVCLLFLLCTGLSFAQMEKIREAYTYTTQQDRVNLDSARILINEASKFPETMNDAQTWYFRGFIYKELFRKSQAFNRDVLNAEEAFNSCRKSIQLDSSAENRGNNMGIIRNLSALANNTFGETLDTIHYTKALECLGLQKKLVKFLKPKASIDSVEVNYYGIMGSYFQMVYERNPKKNIKYINLAEDSYNKVLILEPNNVSANYNMGIIYYNQAVSLIMNKLDYDFDLATLNDIQDEALVWFKKSLPYMEKAYQLNPRRKETLIGLSGIYYSLHENEKSQQFQKLSQDMDGQK